MVRRRLTAILATALAFAVLAVATHSTAVPVAPPGTQDQSLVIGAAGAGTHQVNVAFNAKDVQLQPALKTPTVTASTQANEEISNKKTHEKIVSDSAATADPRTQRWVQGLTGATLSYVKAPLGATQPGTSPILLRHQIAVTIGTTPPPTLNTGHPTSLGQATAAPAGRIAITRDLSFQRVEQAATGLRAGFGLVLRL